MKPKAFQMKDFSKRLTWIRLYRGYGSQNALAEKLGVCRQEWSLFELGRKVYRGRWRRLKARNSQGPLANP